MDKPIAKYEIYTEVLPNNKVHICAESDGMKERVHKEASQFGEVTEHPNNIDGVDIRPTFDQWEVAKWLGRGGPVVVVNYAAIPPIRSVIADGHPEKTLDEFTFDDDDDDDDVVFIFDSQLDGDE